MHASSGLAQRRDGVSTSHHEKITSQRPSDTVERGDATSVAGSVAASSRHLTTCRGLLSRARWCECDGVSAAASVAADNYAARSSRDGFMQDGFLPLDFGTGATARPGR